MSVHVISIMTRKHPLPLKSSWYFFYYITRLLRQAAGELNPAFTLIFNHPTPNLPLTSGKHNHGTSLKHLFFSFACNIYFLLLTVWIIKKLILLQDECVGQRQKKVENGRMFADGAVIFQKDFVFLKTKVSQTVLEGLKVDPFFLWCTARNNIFQASGYLSKILTSWISVYR